MRKVCLFCQRTASDNHLFCQETYCRAEQAPYILDPGEWLGDIEIIRPLSVLRAATLYEARRGSDVLLLKVAHPGQEHTERLKREAQLFYELSGRNGPPGGLAHLVAPYVNSKLKEYVYGRAVLQGHLHYYCLFKQFGGVPLSDVLLDRPQLWVYHVGWIVADVATAVAELQSRGIYHYGLRPEVVLVRFDERSGVPSALLWDLGVSARREELAASWHPESVPPAYTDPELVSAGPAANYATDVYGLGLILYELLNGKPAFPHRLASDADVARAVASGIGLTSGRDADVRDVAELCDRAISRSVEDRPTSAAELATALRGLFPPPRQRPRWWPTPRA